MGEHGVGSFSVVRVDVAERLDVGVAVELGNAVDVICIVWVACCGEVTGAAVAVDYHLPVHTGVLLYGVEDACPCGEAV